MIFFLLFAASRVFFGATPSWLSWLALINWLLPPLLTTIVIAALFRVFAPGKLDWRALFIGGASAAILLSVMRPVFGLVLRYNPGYGYAFGSLKAIFLLLVWVYYLFAATLLGAEIMANFHRRESLLLRKLFTTTPRGRIDTLTGRFTKSIADGTELFREGDAGAEMFYVISGAIELRKGSNIVKTARPGDYFGEMSLLLDATRTATAIARGDASVVTISRGNFDTIVRENPAIVSSLLQEMARRLKATTDGLVGAPK
jgi:hypothetical protein